MHNTFFVNQNIFAVKTLIANFLMKAVIKNESFEKGLVKQHVVNDMKVKL